LNLRRLTTAGGFGIIAFLVIVASLVERTPAPRPITRSS